MTDLQLVERLLGLRGAKTVIEAEYANLRDEIIERHPDGIEIATDKGICHLKTRDRIAVESVSTLPGYFLKIAPNLERILEHIQAGESVPGVSFKTTYRLELNENE